jgi:hypothetical protein
MKIQIFTDREKQMDVVLQILIENVPQNKGNKYTLNSHN